MQGFRSIISAFLFGVALTAMIFLAVRFNRGSQIDEWLGLSDEDLLSRRSEIENSGDDGKAMLALLACVASRRAGGAVPSHCSSPSPVPYPSPVVSVVTVFERPSPSPSVSSRAGLPRSTPTSHQDPGTNYSYSSIGPAPGVLPPGWVTNCSIGAAYVAKVDEAQRYTGLASLSISGERLRQSDNCSVTKRISAIKFRGKTIRLNAATMTEKVEGGTTVGLVTETTGGKRLANSQSPHNESDFPNGSWQPMSTDLFVGPTAETLAIVLTLRGPGTAWFSRVNLDQNDSKRYIVGFDFAPESWQLSP